MAPTGINRPGFPSSRAPTGINRPGFPSPKTPTNINRPGRDDNDRNDGPNIVIKPKPSIPTFRQPPRQSVFAPTTSSGSRMQYYDRLGGGVAPLADIQNITNRYQRAADIPLFQQRQKDFNQFMQATEGTGNISGQVPVIDGRYVLSMQEPTLTARQPTFGEAGQDFMRGAGAFADALVKKGTPMMNLVKDLYGGVQNFFGNQMDKAQGFLADQMASQNQFNQQLLSLTPQQRMIYDQLIFQPGMTRENAYAQAVGQGFAMGGIATLN